MDSVLSEAFLSEAVDFLVRIVEAAGASIFVGAAVDFVRFVFAALHSRDAKASCRFGWMSDVT